MPTMAIDPGWNMYSRGWVLDSVVSFGTATSTGFCLSTLMGTGQAQPNVRVSTQDDRLTVIALSKTAQG
jgi:hypothetical protein